MTKLSAFLKAQNKLDAQSVPLMSALQVLVHSYFLIPPTRGSAALAKEGISTGMNLSINGKYKQFHIMEKLSVLKQMDFTA